MNSIKALVRRKVKHGVSIYRKRGLVALIDTLYHRWAGSIWDEILWQRSSRTLVNGDLKVSVGFGTLLVHPQDRGISKELALYHVHEPVTTEFMKGFLKEGMVGIDIGANLGYYVLLEKRLVGNEGRIVAIEPVPRNLELLRQNIALNGLSGVTVVGGAVGERDGVGTMFISRSSNWHSLFPSCLCDGGAIEVPMCTLDSLVHRLQMPRVDFVRMDVEGYEANILSGMKETLRKFRPRLLMEVHGNLLGHQETALLLKELKRLGYETQHLVEREFDLAWIRPAKPPHRKPFSIDELLNGAVGDVCFLAAFAASSSGAAEG